MTTERAIELLKIEKTCIMWANDCDRDCGNCELVQDDEELLAAFDKAIEALEKSAAW